MRIAKILTAALLGLVVTGAAAKADVLDDIKKRGTLIVGVKADYKPFGFRDPSGGIIGIEPDLAGPLEVAEHPRRPARLYRRVTDGRPVHCGKP